MFGNRGGPASTGSGIRPAGPTEPSAAPAAAAPSSGPRRSEAWHDTKAIVFAALLDTLDLSQLARLDLEQAREEIRDLVGEIIGRKNIPLAIAEQEDLIDEICNDVLGLGPLEALLARDDISDILVNGAGRTYVAIGGRTQETSVRFRDSAQLLDICHRIAGQAGQRIDEANPICDARLPDGSRVNIVLPPLAVDGPVLTIRKFRRERLTMERLVANGTITAEGATILDIAVASRCNILVSGGPGAGKTTLLNALAESLPPAERIITCEEAGELQLRQPHVIRLETRGAGKDGGAVGMRDLVRNSMRMRPERIVVGELGGAEAFDLLQAMATGHDGTMATLDASAPREAIGRIEAMVAMAGLALPPRAVGELIGGAVNLIVHVGRFRDGARRVTHITEITGADGDVVLAEDLLRFEATGEDGDGRILGRHVGAGPARPALWERARGFGLESRLAAALDAALRPV